jgi:hypothetical protein
MSDESPPAIPHCAVARPPGNHSGKKNAERMNGAPAVEFFMFWGLITHARTPPPSKTADSISALGRRKMSFAITRLLFGDRLTASLSPSTVAALSGIVASLKEELLDRSVCEPTGKLVRLEGELGWNMKQSSIGSVVGLRIWSGESLFEKLHNFQFSFLKVGYVRNRMG